jgi:AraC-like DNA-binding protein
MEEFFRYLTPRQDDIQWGLYVNCAGKLKVEPGGEYPPQGHHSAYYFKAEEDMGRILNEYQIHYITEGEGIYENKAGTYKVSPGSLMISKPGYWHRFRPEKETGWIEHYVGFNGRIADELFKQPWFTLKRAVIFIGNREEFIDTYFKAFTYIIEEKPGFQQVTAAMIMKLLGFIVCLEKQKDFPGHKIEQMIDKARFIMRENVETRIDFQVFAKENDVGYSYFRKKFKNYTGVPPMQYHLDLKMLRAKEMLLHTDKIIKEISFELGFSSPLYFSRIFHKKFGLYPSEFRKTTLDSL